MILTGLEAFQNSDISCFQNSITMSLLLELQTISIQQYFSKYIPLTYYIQLCCCLDVSSQIFKYEDLLLVTLTY